jgi:hypothetical protein
LFVVPPAISNSVLGGVEETDQSVDFIECPLAKLCEQL